MLANRSTFLLKNIRFGQRACALTERSSNYAKSKITIKNATQGFRTSSAHFAGTLYGTSGSQAFIEQQAPLFSAKAVVDGEIKTLQLTDYKGKWVVLLFYPMDFTFVCPTEIIAFSDHHSKFEALNTQVLALSTDTEYSHLAWTNVPRKQGGLGHMDIPLIGDTTKSIAADYGVLMKDKGIALRGLFIIDPEGILQHITVNGLSVGRSVDETLRLIQAYQYVKEHGEVCPANWKPGDKAMKTDDAGSQEYFATVMAAQDNYDPFVSSKIADIKSIQDYENILKNPKVVIDFIAPYCGKCRQIMPFVDQLSEMFSDITFAKFDTTDENLSELSKHLGVKDLPSFHCFLNGNSYGDPVVGYKKKSLKACLESLSSG